MKCARCSVEIPAQSQFCLRCGTPVSHTTPGLTGTPSFAPPKAKNRPLLITIAILGLAVLALGVTVGGQMLQKAHDANGGQLVQAPGNNNGGSLVQAPGNNDGNKLLKATADPKPNNVVQQPGEGNHADIEDYLQKLKRIEASKQILMRKQIGNALMDMAKAKALSASIEESDYNNTFNDLGKSMNYDSSEWNALTAELNKLSPPPSCRDLHNKYYDHLGKIQAVIVMVNETMGKVQSDPSNALQALTQMQGKASADVDGAILVADDALAEVCSKYKIRKDWDIKGDGGSANMFR